MPLEISKQQNAKVFSREIIDNFKNAKVFSREKKLIFQANLRRLPEIRCYRKNQRHMVDIINTYAIFSFFQSINPLQ